MDIMVRCAECGEPLETGDVESGYVCGEYIIDADLCAFCAAEEVVWLRELLERYWSCPNWGKQPDGHYGPCGKCDICLAAEAGFVKEIYDALKAEDDDGP